MPSIATPAAVSSSPMQSRSFARSVREEAGGVGFFKTKHRRRAVGKRMDQVLQIWFGLERLSALTYNSVFNKGPVEMRPHAGPSPRRGDWRGDNTGGLAWLSVNLRSEAAGN